MLTLGANVIGGENWEWDNSKAFTVSQALEVIPRSARSLAWVVPCFHTAVALPHHHGTRMQLTNETQS